MNKVLDQLESLVSSFEARINAQAMVIEFADEKRREFEAIIESQRALIKAQDEIIKQLTGGGT